MSERVTIDKGGRIVIPKAFRDALGLRNGDLLVVEKQDSDIVIRAEEEEGGLVRRGKLLFKPKDRKAGSLDPEAVTRLIGRLRDPETRHALEPKARKRRKRSPR